MMGRIRSATYREAAVASAGRLAGCVALAFACSSVQAQYNSDHEDLDASADGTLLNTVDDGTPQQGGFYIPVVGSWSGKAYTYAGNALGIPANPNGGEQFVAVTGDTSGPVAFARAQRNVTWGGGTGIWSVSFDICAHFGGEGESAQNIGSFSTQTYPGDPHQTFIALARWTDPLVPTEWNADYVWYNEAGTSVTEIVLNQGFQNLAVDHWYRWTTIVDLDTNRIIEVRLTDLENGTTVTECPPNRYAGGGAAGGTTPTGFRYFGGGGVSFNTLAFDNPDISTDGGGGGETCDAATLIGNGSTGVSNANGTGEAWFDYTAAAAGNVTINICDADFATDLEVLGACGGAILGADPCTATLLVEACDHLLIRVGGAGGAQGNATLAISFEEIPEFGACCLFGSCEEGFLSSDCSDLGGIFQGDESNCVPSSCIDNDDCENAPPIETGQTPFDNTTASTDGPDSCPTPAVCDEDTNGDGTVDVQDLTNVILDWGSDGSGNGGDVTGDGVVDVSDLTAVILAWGDCPDPAPAMSGDVWFVWTADFTGTATANTCVEPGQDVFDTVMAVYAGAACPPTEVLDCNDDDPDGPGGGCSIVTFEAVEGNEYLLQVGGWAGNLDQGGTFPPQTGNGTITIGQAK